MSDKRPVLPVRLWRRLEDGVPRVLPAERRFFRLYYAARSPTITYYDWRKWHRRPEIGDQVQDCAYRTGTVVGFGATRDDLILDNGWHCSWMHCCDPVDTN